MKSKELTNLIKASVLSAPSMSWPTYNGMTLTREAYLTASEASRCVRELGFEKRGALKVRGTELSDEAFSQLVEDSGGDAKYGYFERGHRVEAWVVDQIRAMLSEDEHLFFAGDEQVSFYSPLLRVSGTPDGVIYNSATGVFQLLEIKSANVMVSRPKPEHVQQMQINMGLIRWLDRGKKAHLKLHAAFDFDFPNEEIPEWAPGLLLYVSPNNFFDMAPFEVPYDKGEALNDAAMKAKSLFGGDNDKLYHLTKPMDLEPQGLETNKCYFCDFKTACAMYLEAQGELDKAKQLGVAPTPPEDLPIFKAYAVGEKEPTPLAVMAAKVAKAKSAIKVLERSIKGDNETVREAVEQTGPRAMKVETEDEKVYAFTISDRKGSRKVDYDLIETDGKTERYVSTGKPGIALNVSEV